MEKVGGWEGVHDTAEPHSFKEGVQKPLESKLSHKG